MAIYRKKYAIEATLYIATTGRKTGPALARYFKVSERTIYNWKAAHPDFKNAVDNARDQLNVIVNSAILKNVMKNKITKGTGPDGPTTTTTPPQAADITVALKAGLGGFRPVEEKERREFIKRVVNQKIRGDLTSLQAMQKIEAEGYNAPKSIEIEAKIELNNSSGNNFLDSILTDEQLQQKNRFMDLLTKDFEDD